MEQLKGEIRIDIMPNRFELSWIKVNLYLEHNITIKTVYVVRIGIWLQHFYRRFLALLEWNVYLATYIEQTTCSFYLMSRCAWCHIHVTNKLCFSLKHITLYNGLWFYLSVLSDKDSWLFRTCWDNWVVTARSL